MIYSKQTLNNSPCFMQKTQCGFAALPIYAPPHLHLCPGKESSLATPLTTIFPWLYSKSHV